MERQNKEGERSAVRHVDVNNLVPKESQKTNQAGDKWLKATTCLLLLTSSVIKNQFFITEQS